VTTRSWSSKVSWAIAVPMRSPARAISAALVFDRAPQLSNIAFNYTTIFLQEQLCRLKAYEGIFAPLAALIIFWEYSA
jgi:hypothetical protein